MIPVCPPLTLGLRPRLGRLGVEARKEITKEYTPTEFAQTRARHTGRPTLTARLRIETMHQTPSDLSRQRRITPVRCYGTRWHRHPTLRLPTSAPTTSLYRWHVWFVNRQAGRQGRETLASTRPARACAQYPPGRYSSSPCYPRPCASSGHALKDFAVGDRIDAGWRCIRRQVRRVLRTDSDAGLPRCVGAWALDQCRNDTVVGWRRKTA